MDELQSLKKETREKLKEENVTFSVRQEIVTLTIDGIKTISRTMHRKHGHLFVVKLDDEVKLSPSVFRILLSYWEQRALMYNSALKEPFAIIAIHTNQSDVQDFGYLKFNGYYVKEFKPGLLTQRMKDVHSWFAPLYEKDPLFSYDPWFVSHYFHNIGSFYVYIAKTGFEDTIQIRPVPEGYKVRFQNHGTLVKAASLDDVRDACHQTIEEIHRANRLNTVYEAPRTHFTYVMNDIGIQGENVLNPLYEAILPHFEDGEAMEQAMAALAIPDIVHISTLVKNRGFSLFHFPWCSLVMEQGQARVFQELKEATNYFEQIVFAASLSASMRTKYQQLTKSKG